MQTNPDVEARPRATKREWIGLAVLALPTLLLSLDVSVLYLALPQIGADLGADATQQLWILDIYSFMLAGFLVTMGTLGDRIGRRRLLLIGAAAFGVMSVVAAYSTSPEMLIVARALLGVAGATLMPSTMALIRNMFHDPQQMAMAIAVWFACFMGGLMLGPLVGGVLLEHFWWGSAFLLGVPLMLLLLVVGPLLLPEYRDASAGAVDLASVALYLAAILPVIYGLKEVARDGMQPSAVISVVAGLVFGFAFLRRQRSLASPLLDLTLFANKSFNAALAVMSLGGVVMAGVSLMATLYLQLVEGLSPLTAGLWLIPQNVAMIAGSLLAPVWARRVHPSTVMGVGLAIAAVGLALHTQVNSVGGLGVLVTGLVLASGGIALPLPLTTNLMLTSAPPEKAGSVASLSETSAEFGIALGVATMGSIGTFVYRSQLDDTVSGVPDASADAARESLAEAVSVAPMLPADIGTRLLEEARESFTVGLNIVGGLGSVIFVGLAAAIVVALRHGGASSATESVVTVPEPDPARTTTNRRTG